MLVLLLQQVSSWNTFFRTPNMGRIVQSALAERWSRPWPCATGKASSKNSAAANPQCSQSIQLRYFHTPNMGRIAQSALAARWSRPSPCANGKATSKNSAAATPPCSQSLQLHYPSAAAGTAGAGRAFAFAFAVAAATARVLSSMHAVRSSCESFEIAVF